ncbi:T9SS type A sorting domain-containing protein [Candidatus Fermentibacterales bacterium]|nr:T9SS type A sorting domain-containing protein [Candidatus Fermentibacterales bacterium]
MAAVILLVAALVPGQLPGQPYSSYWFPTELLSWSPETDPDAPYNRGSVPLADRFVGDILVNPHARPGEAGVSAISIMYPSTSGNPSQGANVMDVYAFNYWQYVEVLTMWGGSAGEGLIVSPSADVIDAAHRNGVPVYGTIFFPPTQYGGQIQWVWDLVQREGPVFPVADKLIEVAEYYGFDGWFINQETAGGDSTLAVLVREFMIYIQESSDLEIQWYDAMIETGGIAWQNALNSLNDMFFQYGDDLVSEGMFLNFWWTTNGLLVSRSNAIALGRSPYDLFAGVDVQASGYNTSVNWDGVFPEAEEHVVSLGFYCPDWCYSSSSSHSDFYEKANRFWVGANRDPGNTWTTHPWKGLAHYIPATSPVNDLPFVTSFNTGQGRLYAIEGEIRATHEWNNRSLQDVLPTWRWICESAGTPLYPELWWDDAWYGGSCLRVSGDLQAGAASLLRLYKTDLHLEGGETLVLRYDSSQLPGQESCIAVALCFEDAPGVFELFDAGTVTGEGWNGFEQSLSSFAGRTVVQIGLRFASASTHSDYEALVGMIGIIAGSPDIPSAPTGLYVESFQQMDDNNGTIRLRWTHSPDAVRAYDVYRLDPDSSWSFLGSSPGEAYFVPLVQRAEPETETTILVQAVSPELGFSEPAAATITWTITGMEGDETGPALILSSPVPNPVGPTGASVRYSLPAAGPSRLDVYSIDGRLVDTLLSGQTGQGWHDLEWYPEGLCSGVYFLRLEGPGGSRVRKCLIAR